MERRQLTLMFTDIVGYSRLMGANESQTIGLLDEYRRILLTRIQECHGSVIEFIGDAVFARFDKPLDAVNAGIAIQNDLHAFNANAAPGQPALRTRIGIHTGEVALKDGALYGDDVNIAARLEPIAVADGLCVSESVYESVKNELNLAVKSLGVQPLKNIDAKVQAYLIRPAGITFNTHAHYALRTFQQKIQAYRYPLALALVCIIAAGFYFIPRWLVPGYTANYVEIADFKNLMSENGEPDYFSAGVTEALRSQLADMEDVYILDPSKGVRGPVRVEGSVQKIGESLRIAYRLFRRKDNVQIAGGKLDGAYNDIFILQDRIVAEIGRYLAQEFDLKFFRPAVLNLTADVTAYDYYLKGMEYLRLPETHENFDQAIKYMTTALVHDGEFAGANAGICRAYRGKYKLTQDAGLLDKAEEYCLLALSQDDKRADVHFSFGVISQERGDFEAAIKHFKKALSIDIKSVDALIGLTQVYQDQNNIEKAEVIHREVLKAAPLYWRSYYDYSYFLISQGRMDESVSVLKKSLSLTPENEPALSNLGVSYWYSGNYKKGVAAFERAAEIAPSAIGFSNAATGYYYLHDYEKSVEMFDRAVKLAPEDFRLYINLADASRMVSGKENLVRQYCMMAIELVEKLYSESEYSPDVYKFLSVGYFHLGDRVLSEKYINEAFSRAPNDIDVLFTKLRILALSEKLEESLDLLEKLVLLGYPLDLIKADPDLDVLRGAAEYRKILSMVE